MQVEELAAGVGHAADFGDTQLEAGLVTREVIADQFAAPYAKEVTRMLASTARAEVVDHGFQCLERRLSPDIGAVRFLFTWRQYLYGCFIGMHNSLG